MTSDILSKELTNMIRPILVTSAFLVITTLAYAGDQVGTLTQLQGQVKLFTHPSKTLQDESQGYARALFEGEYYLVQDAKLGDRVDKGNILRTAPSGKVRVVFDNGDQYNVGAGTAYRVFWDKDTKDAHPEVKLMYGKLRGIVEKGGPRSHLKVRTRAATMGVRGTDFFIADDGADNETEISILRGEVDVKPTNAAPEVKAVAVKSGQSAAVTAKETPKTDIKVAEAPKPVAPLVELRKTTQEDLIGIQKSSVIKPAEKTAEKTPETPEAKKTAAATAEIAKKIEKLETKAIETTIQDIRKVDPTLVAKLDMKLIKSIDEVNARQVESLLKEAPKAPPSHKAYKSELEDLEGGAYEKYFKIFD